MSKRQARDMSTTHPKKPHTTDTALTNTTNTRSSAANGHRAGVLVDKPLVAITNIHRYNKLEKLGEGNYGAVYKALDTTDNTIVALKKIKLDNCDDGCPSTALREAVVLQTLRHENVVYLKDIIYQPLGSDSTSSDSSNSLYLVFEHSDSDLRRFLDAVINESKHQPPAALCRYIMYQMMDGLAYMHENGFLHRDLKPQNILVDTGDCACRLGDLGLARQYAYPLNKYTHEISTLWYRAPEILLGAACYSTATDVWSMGCIMAELLTGIPLFSGDSEIGQLFLTFQTTGTPTPQNWPDCVAMPDWHSTFPQWQKKSVGIRIRQLIRDKLQYCKEAAVEQLQQSVAAGVVTERDLLHLEPEAISEAEQPWKEMSIQDDLAIDLIERCIELDPAKRISCVDALQHPYFHTLDVKQAQRESHSYAEALATRMTKRKK